MAHWTEVLSYGHGGLVVTALAAAGAAIAYGLSTPRASPSSVYVTAGLAAIPAVTELLLSTWYLFSPTYIDHIEASAASVAQYFLQGVPIYPDLDSYTFHGLVYGPLLAEANSVGYLLGSGVFASKLIGWMAAWTGVAIILLTARRAERNWAWAAGAACAVCVLTSFGNILTADRADSLLLLCAALALFSVTRLPELPGLAVAALLAGAAMDLKPDGAIYVVPALCLWAGKHLTRRQASWLPAGLIAAGAGAAGILLPFMPASASLSGYLNYVELATRHGLIWDALMRNCAFLVSFWAPVAVVLLVAPPVRDTNPGRGYAFAAALIATELVVAVIASKPGAGAHHLLPFLAFHAFLLQRLLARASLRSPSDPRPTRAAIIAIAAVLLGTAWPAGGLFRYFLRFDLQLPEQEATRSELARFASGYPHGMMGIADATTYRLTSFRPWLTLNGTRQTDYGALMDWRLSGVSDAPLANALERCEIPYVFVPRGGVPFNMRNGYGGPLFSDAVRADFALRYSLIESGRYFNVFGCSTDHDLAGVADRAPLGRRE